MHVTEAESEILEALWREPLTPPRLMHAVKSRRDWTDSTIKTLLSRLMQKNLVKSERDDGRLQYRALIDRQTYVEAEVRRVLTRLFDGDKQALMTCVDALKT